MITHPPAHPEAGLTSLHQRGDIPIQVITAEQLQCVRESAHLHTLASSPHCYCLGTSAHNHLRRTSEIPELLGPQEL